MDSRDGDSLKTDVNESNRSQAQLYIPNIELERYKAKLDFWKFTLVSGFAAIVITAIPPSFQLATAHLESVKANAERLASEQRFQDQYVQQFLDKALAQDIELRIRFADYFANVSAMNVRDGWVKYRDSLKENRENIRVSIEGKRREIADIGRAQASLSSLHICLIGEPACDQQETRGDTYKTGDFTVHS